MNISTPFVHAFPPFSTRRAAMADSDGKGLFTSPETYDQRVWPPAEAAPRG